MSKAELLWVKCAQNSMSQEREFALHSRQFNLFEDEKGVWWCKGRLSNTEVLYVVKNHILLTRSHPSTTLIMQRAHERILHDGIRMTPTEIRKSIAFLQSEV